jgi:signal transduction histidine kinase
MRVCNHHGWSFGHGYLRGVQDTNELVPVVSYYEDGSDRFRSFRDVSARRSIKKGEGLPGRVFASDRAESTTDLAGELTAGRGEAASHAKLRSGAAFPIRVGKDVLGVMEFFAETNIELNELMLYSMASIGTQVGHVIARKRLAAELARAAVEEQRRIGQDLHDTVGQELAGLALSAERTERRLRHLGLAEAEDLHDLAAGVRTALEHMRRTVRHLVTAVSEPESFPDTLADLADSIEMRSDVRCTVRCDVSSDLHDAVTAVQLYRIASEAVANALRHGKANNISILFISDDGGITLQVSDDGMGISESSTQSQGLGLKTMRQRARVIGGSLDVSSVEGGGTVVACRVP